MKAMLLSLAIVSAGVAAQAHSNLLLTCTQPVKGLKAFTLGTQAAHWINSATHFDGILVVTLDSKSVAVARENVCSISASSANALGGIVH